MTDNEKKELGLSCLEDVCRGLEISFTVHRQFVRYRMNDDRCTIKLQGKTFTGHGTDATIQAIKKALLYLVEVSPFLEDIKKQLQQQAEEEEHSIQGLA